MSNCTGCYNSFGDKPNPHRKECEICIRNPKYPTMKMPEKAIIEGIELDVPQDMYIARDRKNFEEKILMKKIAELLKEMKKKTKQKPYYPYPPLNPDKPIKPWEYYWDYIHQFKTRWHTCLYQNQIKSRKKK